MATIQILPRQPGETPYEYRNRVSIAKYGKTLYQRRVERGAARGITRAEARGHGLTPAGQTEYQRRAAATQAKYGKTPYELWRDNSILEAARAGYTPLSTGLSQDQLLRVWPKIKKMNEWATEGGELKPFMIREAMESEALGQLDPGWTYRNIEEKYAAMYFYRNNPRVWDPEKKKYRGDYTYGKARYLRGTRGRKVDVQWWYYH